MEEMKQFHWFWAWADEKEEAYLREMALGGWHLKSVKFPGYFTFISGEPKNDFYRLDFFSYGKDKADYLQLFQDAGWSHVGEYGSWQYFRKTAQEGEILEIFTDNQSKVIKYSRMLAFLVIFLPIYSIMFTNISRADGWFYKGFAFIFFLFMLFYIYAILKFIHRIGQLKKKI